jgi:hypothetical protein
VDCSGNPRGQLAGVAFAGRAGVWGWWTVVTVPSAQVIVTAATGTEAATATAGRISAVSLASVSPDVVGKSAETAAAR